MLAHILRLAGWRRLVNATLAAHISEVAVMHCITLGWAGVKELIHVYSKKLKTITTRHSEFVHELK